MKIIIMLLSSQVAQCGSAIAFVSKILFILTEIKKSSSSKKDSMKVDVV